MTPSALRGALWSELEPVLKRFAGQANARVAGLNALVGSSHNETFTLRAYVSYMRRSSNEEVSITTDIRIQGGLLIVESDLCGEEGKVLRNGPGLRSAAKDARSAQASFDGWLKEFRDFLTANEDYFVSLAGSNKHSFS